METRREMNKYTSITDIPPKATNWEVVVKVIEITPELRSRSGNITYQHYVFEDDKGGRVRGVTFNQDVRNIGRKFSLHKKYRIANADILKVSEEYVRDKITLQWIVKPSTIIDELPDPPTPSPRQYNFTPIPQLQNFVDAKTVFLDVLGLAVACTPSKNLPTRHGEQKIQKFTMIDSEFSVVTLSLWGESSTEYGPLLENELENFPVVICHKVQAGYFNGPEISTNRGSTIQIQPDTPEARELRNWSRKSSAIIHQRVIEHDFTNTLPQLRIRKDNEHVRVLDAVPKGTTSEVTWIKGTLNLRHLVQSYWHVACKKCQRASPCNCGQRFKCHDCGHDQTATPRCKFDVQIEDSSGTIYASAYGIIGEKILGTTAREIAERDCKGEELDVHRTQEMLDTKLFSMQVQMSLARNQNDKIRYTIIYIVELPSSTESVGTSISGSVDDDVQSSSSSPIEGPGNPKQKTKQSLSNIEEYTEFQKELESDVDEMPSSSLSDPLDQKQLKKLRRMG